MAGRRKLVIRAGIKLDQLGFGQALRSGKLDGDVPARHKWPWEGSPYCIANEFICGKIADYLALPIPPFAITYSPSIPGGTVFSSLNFNFDGRNLRPVLPETCVQNMPDVCAGIVLFDILVANCDRHDENLAVDDLQNPRGIQMFDHDVALFGCEKGGGIKRLNELQSRLGISGGSVSQGNRHVLLDHLTSTEHFGQWIDAIYGVPHSFVERMCKEATRFGITKAEADRATKFLNMRKADLRGIISRHGDEFKGIKTWKTL